MQKITDIVIRTYPANRIGEKMNDGIIKERYRLYYDTDSIDSARLRIFEFIHWFFNLEQKENIRLKEER